MVEPIRYILRGHGGDARLLLGSWRWGGGGGEGGENGDTFFLRSTSGQSYASH